MAFVWTGNDKNAVVPAAYYYSVVSPYSVNACFKYRP